MSLSFENLRFPSLRGILYAIRKRRDILTGVVDSGFGSLATFLIGLYAVRVLDPFALGIYALFFRALFMVAQIPTHLVLLPSRVRMVEDPIELRLAHLPRSILLASLPALGASSLLFFMPFLTPKGASNATIVGFMITAAAASFIHPIQDHIRSTLHLSNQSGWAALVSAAQMFGVVIALLILINAPVPAVWVPLGALALANLFSSCVGLYPAFHLKRRGLELDPLRLGSLVASGRWLVMTGFIPGATSFATASVVARLAGSAALGYAEGARVVASPIIVLSRGLLAVLGPRSIKAGQTGGKAQALQRARRFTGLILAAAAAFIALFGWKWAGNPFTHLVPIAYQIEGLVALSILAAGMGSSAAIRRFEILGAKKEARLPGLELVVSVFGIAVAATARFTDAFAVPLSSFTMELIRWKGFRRIMDRYYAGKQES